MVLQISYYFYKVYYNKIFFLITLVTACFNRQIKILMVYCHYAKKYICKYCATRKKTLSYANGRKCCYV